MSMAGATGQSAPSDADELISLKQHEWEQRILEELRDFLHVLSAEGRILHVSRSCERITGWEPDQLLGRYVSEFIHPDDREVFDQEFNDTIMYALRTRFLYRFRKFDHGWAVLESQWCPYVRDAPEHGDICHGDVGSLEILVTSRPYINEMNNMLDSFLEQKFEYVRLSQLLENLRREEAHVEDATPSHAKKPRQYQAAVARMNSARRISSEEFIARNLDEISTSSRDQRSEGSAMSEIVPTDLSVVGDAGINIPKLRATRIGSVRRRIAEAHKCMFCGTLESPGWRKGPDGPKSLCNACGLRWSKRLKKPHSDLKAQSSPITDAE